MQPLRMRELPDTEHPMNRLQDRGAASLSAAELLEIVVGLPCGRELLLHLGGLEGLVRASARQISQLPGIGMARATRVLAAVELGRRAICWSGQERKTINSPSVAADVFLAMLSGELQEHFMEMLLDNRNGLLSLETVYIGTCNTNHIRVAEIMRPPIIQGATSIIVCHNHPSGDVSPSREDVRVTETIVQAGRMFSVDVVDHIIVSSSGNWRWQSLKERGLGGL